MFSSPYPRILSVLSKDRAFISRVRKITGIVPGRPEIYKLAFIHRSSSLLLSDGTAINNERLEFLGDAILDAIISDFIYNAFPGSDEGALTQLRSRIVKRKQLNRLAVKMGIAGLLTSDNNSLSGKNVLGNAFEALIGAIYLDKGFPYVKKFIIREILKRYLDLDKLSIKESDFKSRLIEWAQKNKREIRFVSQEKTGSEGMESVFHSRVLVNAEPYGEGTGKSKKEAEQQAAEQALDSINK